MPYPTNSTPGASPGDRLKDARLRRGLTQEALAERANLSIGVIKKLERGGTGRLETYHAVARALHVRTSTLLDPHGIHETRRNDDDNLSLMPLRQAIAPPITLTGRLTLDGTDTEPDLDNVETTARALANAYHRDGYSTVSDLLPALVRSAHTAAAYYDGGPEHTRAIRIRADVLQMAGRYLTQVRAYDLAHIALRDAIQDAVSVGDLGTVAGAVYQQGWLLMRQGRLDEAEQVSTTTAEAVEPRISRASRRDLGAWGKLLVHASAAAARNNRAGEAREMLRLGRAAGSALGGGGVVAESSWGRFDWRTLAFQGIENHLVAGHPDKVIALSARFREPSTVFMRRHLLDVAQAHAMLGQPDDALGILDTLVVETPEWMRHQRMAAETFHEARRLRRRRLTARLRDLAVFFDAE